MGAPAPGAPDYFTLFSLEPGFFIELSRLEQAYFRLQREYHPDRHAAKSLIERARATQNATLINDAYHTLLSPLKRAHYLLSVQGIDAGNVKPSQDLLMEAMEWREQVTGAGAQLRETLAKQAAGAYQECVAALERAFAVKQYEQAAGLTLRLGYIAKWQEDIKRLR